MLLDTVDCLSTVPLLWLLVLLLPLVYVEAPFSADSALCDDTAGLLYVVSWLPDDTVVLCLETDRLAADVPEDLDEVALLRDTELPPTVPRPVLLLVPTPLLTVVFSVVVTVRPTFCVSCLGVYDVWLEKCPPCPSPGPYPCPQSGPNPPYHPA